MIEGRSVALLEKFEVGAWMELVRQHRPGYVRLPPTALRMVLQAGGPGRDVRQRPRGRLRHRAAAAGAREEFEERFGIPVLTSYGATEFAGAIAGWTLKDKKLWGPRKRGSAGRAHHGIELRVVDPDTGSVLPAGETGLLEARGRQLPGADGAWLRTTDLAAVDDDGFLFIRGRADEAINRGGFKIPPSVIEDALAAHPAVDEASAVALPDARLGQVPAAAVTLLSPATEAGAHGVPHQPADPVPAAGRDQGGGPAAADPLAQDQPGAGPRALLRRFHPHGSADVAGTATTGEPHDRRTGRVRRPHRRVVRALAPAGSASRCASTRPTSPR